MGPDELHQRWNLMLAQAMRFASVGTFAEATHRARQIVEEAAPALAEVPPGPRQVELRALVAQASALVELWRTHRLEKRARSLARGAKERQRELTPPDYEALMEARTKRSSRPPPAR